MLKAIPTEKHLSRMYYELAKIGANSAGEFAKWPYEFSEKEELLALACDMSRFDPRLVDILVDYFARRWKDVDPRRLRECYKNMQTPQTVAVICEFLKGDIYENEAQYFFKYLAAGLKPAEPQFYFHNLYSPGGKLARLAVEESLHEYKKWGFFASERPKIGTFDNSSRKNILLRLLASRGTISIGDYLEKLGHSVSRQQALLDIKKLSNVHVEGKGRNARWKLSGQ